MLNTLKKASKSDVDKIFLILNSIYPLSDSLKEVIYNNMYYKHLEKDEYLLKEGGISRNMNFILKGAVLAYSTHKEKKITTFISVENEFVSSISGMHGATESKEGIKAIEPTDTIYISNEVIQDLFDKYFEFNYVFRVVVQKYYQDAQERSHIVRVGNAKERYSNFLHTKMGYVDRLPAEHLASLLDMKPQTLERIRRQYNRSIKKDGESEMLCSLLEKHLDENAIYKDKDINLASLAKILGISSHSLSSLLNNNYNQNFVGFINAYRIRHIQAEMKNPEAMQNLTIEALAYEAGFASRSAFYTAFKKQVGMSPNEYIQRLNLNIVDVVG